VDFRDRRLAQNEALFREVNERINVAAEGRRNYVCECANRECTFEVPISRADYESIRRDPRQFVVLPGHQMPEVEDVVLVHDDFLVVRKSGEAGAYVERLDPRSRRSSQ
jgi:hypothetical protein